MEREGQEKHEGAKGGVSLEVDVDVVAAALQVGRRRGPAVAVAVLWQQRRPLAVVSSSRLTEAQDHFLQDEDREETRGHDELWQGEAGLLKIDAEVRGSGWWSQAHCFCNNNSVNNDKNETKKPSNDYINASLWFLLFIPSFHVL